MSRIWVKGGGAFARGSVTVGCQIPNPKSRIPNPESRIPSQKTRAVGTGHHRSCTLPMMYLFGTIPQWRLSELLLR